MQSKMKSKIIILFVSGVCLDIVASYRPYPDHGYRQETYQQRRDWSNNQNYPGLAFPVRQPPANYGAPQSVVNYMQASPDENYEQEATYPETQEVILEQQFPQQVVESQSDVIYVEKPPPPPPHTYPEVARSYVALSDRSHEGVEDIPQLSQWQPEPPPPNPVFVDDSYQAQVSRHWARQNSNAYPPSNNQEPYSQPAYPQWQSTGIQKKSYYGSTYDVQNDAPLQYTTHARRQVASAAPVNNFQEHEPQNKQLLDNRPKEHKLEVVNDILQGNSQFFKSDNNETDYQEKKQNKRQENPYKIINPFTSEHYRKNPNVNPREFKHNTEYLAQPEPIVSEETNPASAPVKERYIDNYRYQKHYPIKTNNKNYPEESHAAKPVVNYRPFPAYKATDPYEKRVVEQNIAPAQSPPVQNDKYNNLKKPTDPQVSQTDNVIAETDTNDDKYENIYLIEEKNIKQYIEPLNPLKEESMKKSHEALVSHLAKPHTKIILSPPTTDAAESNSYRNPTFDSRPKDEENMYPNNLSQVSQVANKTCDTKAPPEYIAKSSYYVKPTEASNPLDENNSTTLPNPYLNQLKTHVDINATSELVSTESINNKNKNQTKVSTHDSNDDTSSNAHNIPEDEYKINFINIITNVTEQNTGSENIDVSDPETNTTIETGHNYETASDKDNNTLVESIAVSLTALDDAENVFLIEKESIVKEDSIADIDTNDDDGEADLPENIDLDKEATLDNESGEKQDVDLTNLKNLSKFILWIRSDEGYWDDLYSDNETEEHGDITFNVKVSDLIIERTSKFYMQKNGTFVEETEEIIWEHKDDAVPREIKTTKTIRNPEPLNRSKRVQTSKCSKQSKA